MKELLHLQEQIKGTSREDVPEFLIATLPKCQLQVVPHLTVCCHMAQAVEHLNKMCVLSQHCKTLVTLQKITVVHCINSSSL
jgi:hypothetical protein